jgi:hypothetical protein
MGLRCVLLQYRDVAAKEERYLAYDQEERHQMSEGEAEKMTRYGTVLVFKSGVSKKQAAQALEKIRDVLQDDYCCEDWTSDERVPFIVHEFDDEMGGPVWYIP